MGKSLDVGKTDSLFHGRSFNPGCRPVAPWQDRNLEEFKSSAVCFQEICLQRIFFLFQSLVNFILIFYDTILF